MRPGDEAGSYKAATASTSTTLLHERWCLSRASLRRERFRLLFSEL